MNEEETSPPSDHHLTICSPGKSELVRNKSRFLGFATRIGDDNELNGYLQELKETYSDASHICHAHRMIPIGRRGPREHFDDDGEPSQTGGYPILQLLKGRELSNSLVAVVRYFGGVELGTGGLARAYRDAARLAIDDAEMIRVFETEMLSFEVDYPEYGQLEDRLGRMEFIENIETNFGERVGIELNIRQSKVDQIESRIASILGREL